MAEVPALNMRLNIDASGIAAGVKKATDAMRQLTQSTDKDIVRLRNGFNSLGATISKQMKIATLAVAAFATKIGVDAVRGAMEDQRQQIALATALRNTTNATDEAIAATVQYLDKKELLVGVDNNELIPSLQLLTQATKDVGAAQELQNLALDISAGTTKDLQSVSVALAKALGGNVGALTKLGVPLDRAAVKAKDLTKIMASLGETFAGQAEKRAQTFEYRLMRLKLGFNQILDQLGYALMPVLEDFARQLSTDILPKIQAWISLNKDKLAASLSQAVQYAFKFLAALMSIGKWIAANTTLIKNLAILFATMFVTTKVYQMVTAINLLTAAIVKMNIAAGAGAIGAVTKTAAKGGILATGAAALAAGNVGNKLGYKIAEAIPGTSANRLKTASKVFGNSSLNPKSPSPMDIAAGTIKATTTSAPRATTDTLADLLKEISKELKDENKKKKDVNFVTVYASNTNDIAKKLAKTAKNGQPIGNK